MPPTPYQRCRLDTLCRATGPWFEFSHPRSDMLQEKLRRSGLSPTIGGCLMRRLCVVGIAFAVATLVMTESVWALKRFEHKHGRHARGCTECCEVTSCEPGAAQSAPLAMPAPAAPKPPAPPSSTPKPPAPPKSAEKPYLPPVVPPAKPPVAPCAPASCACPACGPRTAAGYEACRGETDRQTGGYTPPAERPTSSAASPGGKTGNEAARETNGKVRLARPSISARAVR